MSKVYYDETLKSGERVVVTDSYVRYSMERFGRKIFEQVVPIKSITSVNIGAYTEYSMLKAVCFVFTMLLFAGSWFDIWAGHKYIVVLLFALLSVWTICLFIPSKAVYVCVGSKYEMGVSLKKFKYKDPQHLFDAITKAMEENKL